MIWAKILDKALEFGKWCWQNKWTILFILITVVLLIMNGCQRSEIKDLNTDIKTLKAENVTLESNYNAINNTYEKNYKNYELCLSELEIIKESRANLEIINKTFETEIAKFHDMSKKLGDISDEDELFQKKKEILEELFNGKNMKYIYKRLK